MTLGGRVAMVTGGLPNGQRLKLRDLDKAMEPFRQVPAPVGNSIELLVELHGLRKMSNGYVQLLGLERGRISGRQIHGRGCL
jgi:hypothetical protein